MSIPKGSKRGPWKKHNSAARCCQCEKCKADRKEFRENIRYLRRVLLGHNC